MRPGPATPAPGPRAASLALSAAVALLSLVLAGCVSVADLDALVYQPRPEPVDEHGLPLVEPPRSQADPDAVFEHLEARIPSFDGIGLVGDAWKPAGDGPFPVIIILSPYFDGAKDPENDNRPAGGIYGQVVDFFVPRGYAVALVDLRGTRNSDGCIDLAGPAEQADAAAVVEHYGTQPWSNGKVGMIGGSYDGLTQQEAAVMQPEHLAAIVPIAPVADWYHVQGKGGAKYAGWTPGTPWTYNFGIGMGLPFPGPGLVSALPGWLPEDTSDPRVQRADDQACAALNLAGASDPTGDYNLWMQQRDLRPGAAQATAPMFYVHGLVDLNARPDHIDPWYNAYGGPKKAFLWQMFHAGPSEDNSGRDDWWDMVHAWFDHWLLGLDNEVPDTLGQVEVQDSYGRWRFEEAWPPADAAPWSLYLDPPDRVDVGLVRGAEARMGALVPVPPAAAATAVWEDDPFEAGGTLGARSGQVPNTASASRLVFLSEPLEEDVHYAGRPVVQAHVATDRANSLVVARLYEVLPDGAWVMVNRGVHSLRHASGLEDPQLVVPGMVVEVPVAMQPQDFVLREGRRIGITLTSADADYILPTGLLATNTLHTGAGAPSALVLPRITRGLEDFHDQTWGPAQPAWMGPAAPPPGVAP